MIKVQDALDFNKMFPQLQGIYDEMSLLSKKTPDGPINKFKLGFVNELLAIANRIIGAGNRPFQAFEQFDLDGVPTSSDVVLMLLQYIKCLEKFRSENTYFDSGSTIWSVDEKKKRIEVYTD